MDCSIRYQLLDCMVCGAVLDSFEVARQAWRLTFYAGHRGNDCGNRVSRPVKPAVFEKCSVEVWFDWFGLRI